MPRIGRAVAAGYPHHVTQRGNYRRWIFERERDYLKYLKWLEEYTGRFGLEIWAYCLMPNHVHLVCVPRNESALSRTFHALHMRYSQYINQRQQVRGHLWQGRFYSAILDDAHVHAAVRYVENNPVRAGMVAMAEDYLWSSARQHIEGRRGGILSADCYLLSNISDWRSYLRENADGVLMENIRKNSLTGRPCGDESFVRTLEMKFGRPLISAPRGRPSLRGRPEPE